MRRERESPEGAGRESPKGAVPIRALLHVSALLPLPVARPFLLAARTAWGTRRVWNVRIRVSIYQLYRHAYLTPTEPRGLTAHCLRHAEYPVAGTRYR
jgi:hypothetical protein